MITLSDANILPAMFLSLFLNSCIFVGFYFLMSALSIWSDLFVESEDNVRATKKCVAGVLFVALGLFFWISAFRCSLNDTEVSERVICSLEPDEHGICAYLDESNKLKPRIQYNGASHSFYKEELLFSFEETAQPSIVELTIRQKNAVFTIEKHKDLLILQDKSQIKIENCEEDNSLSQDKDIEDYITYDGLNTILEY